MAQVTGRVLSLSGGHYLVLAEGKRYLCTARGSFRRREEAPLTGDRVEILPDNNDPELGVVTAVLPRKNALVRPPLANLDKLFVAVSVKSPRDDPVNLDKLSVIALHRGIETVPVFTKSELDPERAAVLTERYRLSGFKAECVSREDPEGARARLLPMMAGCVSALTGASGAGKSTLVHLLFPALSPEVGAVSEKSQRGRHTTRVSTLYPLADLGVDEGGFLADTPGFSMLDLNRFFAVEKEDLAFCFPEFAPLLGTCRYTRCTHRTELGCAVIAAVQKGSIPPERHDSYRRFYDEIAALDPYKKAKK